MPDGWVGVRAGSRVEAGAPDVLVQALAGFPVAVVQPDALAAQVGCDSAGAPGVPVVARAGFPAVVGHLDALAAQAGCDSAGCDSALLWALGPTHSDAPQVPGRLDAPQVPAHPDEWVAAAQWPERAGLRRGRRGSRQPERE